ncbi:MAG: hypothetical protein IJ680_02445 [Paludibacteraceae bacterium]|nr:hypothetical protein [Paludibacteraceae bacterium]
MKQAVFNIVLAMLLLLCLAQMPYGYYVFVRHACMIVFAVMAYAEYERRRPALAVVCGALALLFQPFVKIALGRTVWNVVDVLVALMLIALTASDLLNKNKS